MTRDTPDSVPSDADLVAYLDGELSPLDSVRIGQRLTTDTALANRATLLTRGGRPFQDAFAPLLADAPLARLDAMLSATLVRSFSSPKHQPPAWLRRRRPAAVAAATAFMVAGAGLDRYVVGPLGTALSVATMRGEDQQDWRRSVAQYLSLYTRDTLADAPTYDVDQRSALAGLGDKLGLRLTPTQLEVAGMVLKRADLYDYDGKPIVFLAYLDPQGSPVALCITPGDGDDAQRTETRRGMPVVYWAQGGHRFMVIGHAPTDRLQALATKLANRFEDNRGNRG